MNTHELEAESDRLSDVLDTREGGREAFIAMLQAKNGIEIDQRCPTCNELILVNPFREGFTQGCSVKCPCGLIKTDWRGL